MEVLSEGVLWGDHTSGLSEGWSLDDIILQTLINARLEFDNSTKFFIEFLHIQHVMRFFNPSTNTLLLPRMTSTKFLEGKCEGSHTYSIHAQDNK